MNTLLNILKMRIGLFGGCFDPITIGHINICNEILQSGKVDKIWLLISYGSMYGKKLQDSNIRIKMCQAAIGDDDRIEVCTFEIDEQIIDESVIIIEKFLEKYPNDEFYYIIGMDNANKIHTWDNWEKLTNMINFMVVHRPGYTEDESVMWYKQEPHIFLPNIKGIEISSTFIREKIRNGEDISDLVDSKVLTIINSEKLYSV